MSFDIVRGNNSNIIATRELATTLSSIKNDEYEETLYLGYPLSANYDGKTTVDALLVSQRYGIVAFIFTNFSAKIDIIEEQGQLYFQLINTLTQYPSLRKGKKLSFEPVVISIVQDSNIQLEEHSDEYIITSINNIIQILSTRCSFDADYYRSLVESLQKIATIKPKKKRNNIQVEGSKGDIIKKIEKEIANLDLWQKKAAMEIVDGPQRIRGLAGSGKTIVLALKAAYLHAQNPDWEIVITYYTRALWQQYKELITKFVYEFSKDEPNWDKLHIMHAWGSQSEPGVYSEIARSHGILPINFVNAKSKYGSENAFTGICNELIKNIEKSHKQIFDIVLIDEAQDMPASFFKIVYTSVVEPKKIVWAYDELQNLNSATMPSIDEMFGINKQGDSLVNLKNEPDEPMQDIILPVCYRNPPWVLALAHSLGFGIYRSPLVQHFEELELWENIGYKVDSGSLNYGKDVKLSRKKDATPEYFQQLLKPNEVISTNSFKTIEDQYDWVAQQIRKNINEDELDPDDILVIFPSVITSKNEYQKFSQYLRYHSIPSMMAGITHDRDTFRIPGYVSCSAIYRAKGNEAPMVYVLNSDYCFDGFELIKLRNILFTAITRSRAWVRICGVGDNMEKLTSEYDKFREKNYSLEFTVPTLPEMKKLRTINRERSNSDTRKLTQAQRGVSTIIDLVKKGEIDIAQVPEISELVQLYGKEDNKGAIDEEF